MGNEVGRAGFHVKHTKAVSERGAILDEMMRELKDESIKRWAARNPNIVVENEDSNIALVNDGEGGFDICTDPKQVIAYGNTRIAKLSSPIREPKLDPVTGKLKGGTTTTSMFVMHWPKSLCQAVPDFYPVYEHGKEVGRRSRWVARDREEAKRYFDDIVEYLATHVIPGGADAVLGVDIQFSESTPHIHVLADTFAPDPKHPGQLRSEFSRAYGDHRDVRDDKGRQMGHKAKFRQYHAGLKKFMIERGWEIEADVDPLRHDKTATKETYGAMKDKERALAEQEQKLVTDIAAAHDVIESEIKARVDELADERKNLDTERAAVESERQQLQKDKQKALEEARTQGYADGFKEAHTQGYAKGFEEGHSEVDALKEQARQQLDQANKLFAKAEEANMPLSAIHARETFKVAATLLINRFVKEGLDPGIVERTQKWAVGFVNTSGFDEYVMGPAKKAYDNLRSNSQRFRQMVNESTEQLNGSMPDLDDGLSL